MESREFRRTFPDVDLHAPDGKARAPGVLVGHESIPIAGSSLDLYLKFEEERLTYYELTCSLPTMRASCDLVRDQYLSVLPILAGHYGTPRHDAPLMHCEEFLEASLPRDGYPIDRCVIGGMCSWGQSPLKVNVSFARAWPESTFFQLRAIRL